MSKFEAKRTTVTRLYETDGFKLETNLRIGTNRYGDYIAAITDQDTKKTVMINFGNRVRFTEHLMADGLESEYYVQEALKAFMEAAVEVMS